MRKNNRSALWFISEVAGYSKIYIIFLLLVQMVLGISSVFYALLLRGLIDGAVAHDKAKMLTYCFLFVVLVMGQIALRALLRFLEEFPRQHMRMPLRNGCLQDFSRTTTGQSQQHIPVSG